MIGNQDVSAMGGRGYREGGSWVGGGRYGQEENNVKIKYSIGYTHSSDNMMMTMMRIAKKNPQ